MAGLTTGGFLPLTYEEIKTRIAGRLKVFSPGIDLSVESPDGQLIEGVAFEAGQLWSELALITDSLNPENAVGKSLANIGLMSGLPFGAATRSQADVELIGTAGTVVDVGTILLDDAGYEYTTSLSAMIPSTVKVVSVLSGEVPILAGTVNAIKTAQVGFDSVNQPSDGVQGAVEQTDVEFRNLRNKTVLRNFVGVDEVIRSRLLENLGIEQVVVLNNDSAIPLVDGTPAQTIHVTVGEVPTLVTDEDIASTILITSGLGCPTYGSTSTVVNDTQGNPHTINFSKATAETVWINLEVTFLDEDIAGAVENITADLITHINSLVTDEDVVWSRLFGIITPHSKAQVDLLEIGIDGVSYNTSNILITSDKFANTAEVNINIVVN